MEQHADLPEDERKNMQRELGGFKYFYNDSEDSIPLCASLVIVPETAFRYDYNFRLRRSRLEADDEPLQTEFEEAPELIATKRDLGEFIEEAPIS